MTTFSDGRSRETHRQMILSPYKWPAYYLPLKRPGKDGGYDVATLRSAISEKTYNRMIEQGRKPEFWVDENLTLFGPVGEVRRVIFSSPDEILDAGWIVD
jgi:hypothetical protein